MNSILSAELPAKILIVDDSPNSLIVLSQLLHNEGYIVETKQNAETILATVKKIQPDLILLDISMPGVDGYEACQILKADEQTKDIPVIFISGLNSTSDIVYAFSVGGVDYITKPFQQDEVNARVKTHITLRKSLQHLESANKKLIKEEEKLQEGIKNFEAVFNATTDIIIISDLQSNIVNVNPQAIKIYGYSKEEFLKMTVLQLIHPDNKHLFFDFTDKINQYGFMRIESKEMKKDGSTFIAELQISIFEYNGKPHYLGVIRDISKRKADELALIEAKKASDTANKAKSNFLAMMSHEIRTPMNAIIGMTDLSLHAQLDPEVENNLNIIKDSANLLLEIINDILDLSKIEAGKLALEDIDFDLHQLLHNIIRIFSVQIENKGLVAHLEKADGLPQYIKGDPIRLKQILFNLINNAIKFTETGTISINVRQESTSFLVFSVTDTGIGIPEDMQVHIFNSFTQAELSTTRKHGGTGLGLAICKKLVEMMGGHINVTSTPGSGSTFAFMITFKPGDKSMVRPERMIVDLEDIKTGCQKLKILLVEDNQVNTNIAKKFLKMFGHDVIAAMNGKKALVILSKVNFDLVLMDIEMPVMNGLEATQHLRNGKAGPKNIEVPVIAMTAHVLNEFKNQCLEAGMNDFVSKPVNFYELGGILRKYCAPTQRIIKKMEMSLSESNNEIMDKDEALERFDNNQEIFDMICRTFQKDISEYLIKLQETITQKDYDNIHFYAHTLKGLCWNISANTSKNICRKIEVAAKEKDKQSDKLKPLYESLLIELDKVQKIITSSSFPE
jgi:PAS domain S-box-containing protein